MAMTLDEVRRLARRPNHDANRRTMFFAARVSVYVTWLLARTPVSANGVTAVFSVLGAVAAAVVFVDAWWAPLVALALYRVHVVLDVVDGELARLRRTCSPVGAYMDYLTHYAVYSTVGFGMGVHAWRVTGDARMAVAGFALALGLMLNLASRDCWYRAHYGRGGDVEGRRPLAIPSPLALAAARAVSINTLWTLFALAAASRALDPAAASVAMRAVVTAYGIALPVFALARAVVTARSGRIPRRAAWYRDGSDSA